MFAFILIIVSIAAFSLEMAGSAKLVVRGEIAEISLSGDWVIFDHNIETDKIIEQISQAETVSAVVFIQQKLGTWDSSLINFIVRILSFCSSKKISLDFDKLPDGAKRLIVLANSRPAQDVAVKKKRKKSILDFLGYITVLMYVSTKNFLNFLGEICSGVAEFFKGKVRIREQEFAIVLQDVGVRAVPIVALISFLVGLIISFISILQLEKFGASIYVADLVGIAMMREMGCIMTGVIMSGRTGAAFAATIGTMMVNDEVDALQTTGFSSMNFLVLPRMFALTLMMPMLCIFSDFIGIFGGMCASMFMTSLTISQYCTQTANAVFLNDFLTGVIKAGFFGVLIAAVGCLKGMRCGRSAEDVGLATTSAVVVSITAIIVADAVFAIIFSAIGV